MWLKPSHRYWLEFLLAMTEKEIKARYKHAVLGFLWVILNPLLQMLVIGFVFQFFVPVAVDNYFLFLFAGLLPWNFFAYSVTKTTPSIVYERSLIQKAKFPREAIVLSIVLSNLFHFLISLGLFLIILLVWYVSQNGFKVELLQGVFSLGLLVLATFWLLVITASLSLLFSALNVRFRDVNFIIQAVVPLWFYATPVLYTLELLPLALHKFAYFNPLTAIVELYQWSLVGIYPVNFLYVAISLAVSLIVVMVGWKTFIKESSFFDDWI